MVNDIASAKVKAMVGTEFLEGKKAPKVLKFKRASIVFRVKNRNIYSFVPFNNKLRSEEKPRRC